MPLQYPSPYNPYQEPSKPTNWPKIILIGLGILVLIAIIYYALFAPRFYPDSNNNPGIAVGEPNPNGYNCSADVYNCGNFTTQAEAQYVFDYCSQQGKGDIHQLDKDGNGKACEGLA